MTGGKVRSPVTWAPGFVDRGRSYPGPIGSLTESHYPKRVSLAATVAGVPNPFHPSFGVSPPLLVGRETVLAAFVEALEDGPGSG